MRCICLILHQSTHIRGRGHYFSGFSSSVPVFLVLWCGEDPASSDGITLFLALHTLMGFNTQPHPSKYLPKHVFHPSNMGLGPYLPPPKPTQLQGYGEALPV